MLNEATLYTRPEELLSAVLAETSELPKDNAENAHEIRYTVARQIIALMQQHRELVMSWHLEDAGDTVTLMGQVESLVSGLVGGSTSLSSYQYGIPLSPNSRQTAPDIRLLYSGPEWRLSPDNFYISLAVLARRMDIIDGLVAQKDI